jgi:DNA-binding transcriptional MerR regulator|tara:strand:- start:96 stop:425 length:330 start_codon:yes stop_codon:yes gene_type:complete
MKIDTLLKKFLAEKKEVAESCRVSSKSIDFWEKRAESLFSKMDETEDKFAFSTEEVIEAECLRDLKEVDFLMKRMEFENKQLDSLERKIEELEDNISQMLAEHAKKQKK